MAKNLWIEWVEVAAKKSSRDSGWEASGSVCEVGWSPPAEGSLNINIV